MNDYLNISVISTSGVVLNRPDKHFWDREDYSVARPLILAWGWDFWGVIWSVLFYGFENWILEVYNVEKLESFKMWHYCIIQIANVEVMSSINKERELLNTIEKTKTVYLEHLMRIEKYEYLQLLIDNKIECCEK